MDDLYKNIKKERLAQGYSQEELAKACGYSSRSSIARIEQGEVDLPLSKVQVFADALFTTPTVLMGETWEAGVLSEAPLTDIEHFNGDAYDIALLKDQKDYLHETTQGHYIDPEVEKLAQELYDRPELKVLFSTTKKVSKEDLQFVQKMVDTMAKEKNGNDDDIC